MNKEEIIKKLNDKSKRYEYLIENNLSFGDDEYEAYHTLQYINKITSQLDTANKKLDEIEEYIKENACYDKKTKECKCSFSSIALDNILSIIGGE